MPTFDPPPPSRLIRHRQLSPNASVRVSPLCLGTMSFGEKEQAAWGEITKETAFTMLDTFYASGGNFIDTANAYQHGQSEEWLGEWMAKCDNRDEMVLATKYSMTYRKEHTNKIQSNFVGNGSKSMKMSLEASLKKLQTTYVDIFYVHWWDYSTSIEELMHSLNDLVVSGKVLYLGISDAPAWIVSSANRYARDHGLRPFVIYQGLWSVATRDMERDIIPMCRHEGMAIAPYGVLGQGRFRTKAVFEEQQQQQQTTDNNKGGRNFIPVSQRDKDVSAVLEAIAERKKCSLLNVALAYCSQFTPYVFPVVGGRKVEHVLGSIEGLGVELDDSDRKMIQKAYPFDHGFPHTFLSGTMFKGADNEEHEPAEGPADVAMTTTGGTFDWVAAPRALRPSDCRSRETFGW